MVELALIAPVMALLVMGTLDLARSYRMQIQLENAAGQGAAFARITPNDEDCTGTEDIRGAVLDEDPDLASLPNFDVEVWTVDAAGELDTEIVGCDAGTAVSGDRVRVIVTADFDVLTPMVEDIVGETMVITGSNEVVVQG